MTTQNKPRRFTQEDWYGLAGATHFADGSEPLVYYSRVECEDGEVRACIWVADGEGINCMALDGYGDIHADRSVVLATNKVTTRAATGETWMGLIYDHEETDTDGQRFLRASWANAFGLYETNQ